MRFNPLDYPIALAEPARITPSEWLEHVPFGMALVAMTRPRLVVELGTYKGVSYCSFCQAIASLGLDCRAYAVDTWEGDPQSGSYGGEVFAELSRYHDPTYGMFSSLIKSTFADARANFEDGTVDLLHIDGLHTYEAVGQDFSDWSAKLSRRAVVVLHDIMVRHSNFGVWRLWKECLRAVSDLCAGPSAWTGRRGRGAGGAARSAAALRTGCPRGAHGTGVFLPAWAPPDLSLRAGRTAGGVREVPHAADDALRGPRARPAQRIAGQEWMLTQIAMRLERPVGFAYVRRAISRLLARCGCSGSSRGNPVVRTTAAQPERALAADFDEETGPMSLAQVPAADEPSRCRPQRFPASTCWW